MRFITVSALLVILGSVSPSAQTKPAPAPAISVTGCIAQVQRDGSLGAKATGGQATPETAAIEANNPEPTNRYQLNDATSAAPAARPDQGERTTYALRGQEKELAKHVGHRVEIAGTLLPPLVAKLPSKSAATAEGVRAVQVTTIKMIGTNCSVGERK